MHSVFKLAPVLLLTACATTTHPVLYPNETYQTKGKEAAKADEARCEAMAKEAGTENSASTVAGETASGAASGAFVGAVTGSVFGDAKTGAQAGAAQGGSSGFLSGLRQQKPDPLTRSFIERCMAEKGYQVIGWR